MKKDCFETRKGMQRQGVHAAAWVVPVLLGMIVCFSGAAAAQGVQSKPEYVLKAGEKWQQASQMISGQVLSVSPSRIILEQENKGDVSKEIHLNLGNIEEIQFNHLKGLGDVLPGDEVKVRYDDKYVEDEDGKRTQYERTVSLISLVKRSSGGGGKLISREAD